MDILTSCLFIGVLVLLIAATVAIRALRCYVDYGVDPAILDTFRTRIRAWWLLFGLLAAAFICGPLVTTLFFFILSIVILREYITLTPKSPADHQTLFWIYVFFTPLQFIMVGINPDWFVSKTGLVPYQFFSILLPIYVFLILPGSMAASGDPKRFLERTAKLQLGLIICVYSLSYAPALLTIDLPASPVTNYLFPDETPTAAILDHGLENTVIETLNPQEKELPEQGKTEQLLPAFYHRILPILSGKHFQLLFFFVLVVQLGDVFQYLWSHASRRHVVAPKINSNKTWEGVLGGAVTTALLGVSLWYFTPFPQWWQAGLIALISSLMGFAGNMTMSAIKRDRGVSGYGTLIQGHSGFLDRVDSLCFAAPVFYHFAWLFSR
ncbi:MAG: phosphatidate cytidylyltransferase [Planctomycetaceae bacterium]|jgi:phosphatidate cytidylyltransferase|nr:phosphatidate cytidylyltransferase [Planctomycetaceae bacterium]